MSYQDCLAVCRVQQEKKNREGGKKTTGSHIHYILIYLKNQFLSLFLHYDVAKVPKLFT